MPKKFHANKGKKKSHSNQDRESGKTGGTSSKVEKRDPATTTRIGNRVQTMVLVTRTVTRISFQIWIP